MAKLQAKTPDSLFKQIKVESPNFTMRASKEWSPYRNDKGYKTRTGRPLFKLNGGDYNIYNGTVGDAQKLANERNAAVGTHDPRLKEYLPRTSGKYGQVRLPKQWKYKTGGELATAMTRAANVDADDERSYGPSKYSRKVEDILDEIYK